MLERVVYVSRAAPGFGAEAVAAMVAAARARNAREGLSGALLHLDGWFVQVLAGEPGRLAARLARIARDPRHGGLELRIRERVHCPGFRGQPLAFGGAAAVDADLRAAFSYRPGFPVEVFPVDVLVEFVHQALRPEPRRAQG